MKIRVSDFVRLFGVLAFLPFPAQANAPDPPRNIRVVPGVVGRCAANIISEADEVITHLIADYGLSEKEGVFLYSTTVAGLDEFTPVDNEARANALRQLQADLKNMVSCTTEELEAEIAAIVEETGLSDSIAEGIALIRLISRNETKRDDLKTALGVFDAAVLDMQSIVRGCKERQ